MSAAILAVGSVLFYLTCWAIVARYWYGHIRPWTEPIACEYKMLHSNGKHADFCYRRYGYVDTKGEALAYSMLLGLLGPFAVAAILLATTVRRIVTGNQRPLLEEVEAKNRRLERELGMRDR